MSSAPATGVVLNGAESFRDGSDPLPFSVLDFWRWSSSDLLSNGIRGVVAEFLVAQALGCASRPRVEWAAYDVVTPDGLRVEVKTAGYVQRWSQLRDSRPSFGIGLKRSWDAASNTFSAVPIRSADVYVFALHAHREHSTANPLELSQWEFYVATSQALDVHCPGLKQIGLARVRQLCGHCIPYARLREAVSCPARRSQIWDQPQP